MKLELCTTQNMFDNETHKILKAFKIQNGSFNSDQTTRHRINLQEEEKMHFADVADYREKMKESKNIHKFLDLVWALKKLLSIKVTVITFIVGVLRTMIKGLKKRLLEPKTIYTTVLLRSFRILIRIQMILGDLLSLILFILFTNPSARAGYDTRSIFKRSLTGLNSEFSFS